MFGSSLSAQSYGPSPALACRTETMNAVSSTRRVGASDVCQYRVIR
jgi:hypothetical protein